MNIFNNKMSKRRSVEIDAEVEETVVSPIQTRREQRPLKKTKSISDDIGPLMNQFSFEQHDIFTAEHDIKIDEVAEDETYTKADGGSPGSFILPTENGHTENERGTTSTENGISDKNGRDDVDDANEYGNMDNITDVDGKRKCHVAQFLSSASNTVTSLVDSISQTVHDGLDSVRVS